MQDWTPFRCFIALFLSICIPLLLFVGAEASRSFQNPASGSAANIINLTKLEVPGCLRLGDDLPPRDPWYSSVCREVPLIASWDLRLLNHSGYTVYLSNVRWANGAFELYKRPEQPSSPKEDLLAHRIYPNWYYRNSKGLLTRVFGRNVTGPLDPNTCTRWYDNLLLFHRIFCDNHWHALHDTVIPLMVSLSDRRHDSLLASWDPNKVILGVTDTCKRQTPLDQIYHVISSKPLIHWPSRDMEGACFRRVQLGVTQRLNLYVPYDSSRSEDFKTWVAQYTSGLPKPMISRNKDPGITAVWIARRGSRRVLNRDAVIADLRQRFLGDSISVVWLEKLTYSQQIGVFQESDIVIGPHGAGLAKVMFMRPGAGLLQMVPFGMGAGVGGHWSFQKGKPWRKGDNFVLAARYAGVHYTQYNASLRESRWYGRTNGDIGDPASHWGRPMSVWDFLASSKPSKASRANEDYLSSPNSAFSVNVNELLGLYSTLRDKVTTSLK